MIFGAGAASAATSSALVCTTCTFASGAAEPPVVPAPSAAHPSFAGSTWRPTGRWSAGVADAGGATSSAAPVNTAVSRESLLMAEISSSAAVALLVLRLRLGELGRELVQEVLRGHLAEQNLLEQRFGVGLGDRVE